MELTLAELVLINNALNEIINGPSAIDPRDFELRTGVELEEAKKLLDRIGRAVETRSAH